MFSTKHNSDASHVANARTSPEPAEISNRHFIVRLKIAVTRTKQTSEAYSNRNISEGGRESGPPKRRRASRRRPTTARPIQERLGPPALTACAASPTMKFAPFRIGGLQKFASIAENALTLFQTDKRPIKYLKRD